ncbi:MAG: carbon storage regulator CsrA [Clostridiales bacterium]|jgi:carbon storage regulator|nr:carbon storage regulator CsrA [Clostridiales bacterium]
MLVLTRKRNQSIMVNDNIELTIIDIQGDQVRVGINAPKDVKVFRKEVYVEMTQENKEASNVTMDALSLLKNAILKQKK